MTTDEESPATPISTGNHARTGMSDSDAVEKDMSYSPSSETETQQKQDGQPPAALDDDIDPDAINVAPGTGGPDDVGDIEVDPDDLNLPGRATH